MMRTGATRALLRPFSCSKAAAAPGLRFTHAAAFKNAGLVKRTESLAMSAYRPTVTSLVRSYATIPGVTRDSNKEHEVAQGKLAADPALVSSSSSTHAVFSEVGTEAKEEDVDMMAGIRSDLVSADRFVHDWF